MMAKKKPVTAQNVKSIKDKRDASKARFDTSLHFARTRFKPRNLREEMVDKAAQTIEEAAVKGKDIAMQHRYKLLIGGLAATGFFARTQIQKLWNNVMEYRDKDIEEEQDV